MADPAVIVDQLVKRYRPDSPAAVDRLSIQIRAGEVYGLLGANGSGKSTTVGVLATLLTPTSGHARVLGLDVVNQPRQVRRRIGVTLQETGVDPAATGRALLLLHGQLLGMNRRRSADRAAELLTTVGLTDAADRRLRTYSGGMRRRLDLALALIGDPGVLLLDEPTTGLDPLSRQNLWQQVRALREQGTTILLTTQYLEEADQLADRVGILDNGQLRVEGPPEQLKRDIGADLLRLQVDPADTDAAARLLQASIEETGHLSLRVTEGGAALPHIVSTLTGHGVDVRSVSLTRPTLDDVFLSVVGQRLTAPPAPTNTPAAAPKAA